MTTKGRKAIPCENAREDIFYFTLCRCLALSALSRQRTIKFHRLSKNLLNNKRHGVQWGLAGNEEEEADARFLRLFHRIPLGGRVTVFLFARPIENRAKAPRRLVCWFSKPRNEREREREKEKKHTRAADYCSKQRVNDKSRLRRERNNSFCLECKCRAGPPNPIGNWLTNKPGKSRVASLRYSLRDYSNPPALPPRETGDIFPATRLYTKITSVCSRVCATFRTLAFLK